MKILAFIIIIQSIQFVLYDINDNIVGKMAIIPNSTLYLKIDGYLTDELTIKFRKGNTYYIQNSNIKGYVIIKEDIIVIDVIVDNKTHQSLKFYIHENRN